MVTADVWVYVRFQGCLNDFLPKTKREKVAKTRFYPQTTVKHLVESLGVPHTEIGKVYIKGSEVRLDRIVEAGESIEVFPLDMYKYLNLQGGDVTRIRASLCFCLDNHLGKLANYLRMLGYDSLYRNDFDDEELAELVSKEDRILLTRDHRLLMRKVIKRGYWLRSVDPPDQLRELAIKYPLFQNANRFSRCINCNGLLEHVNKEDILQYLQPLTRKHYQTFARCIDCAQIYWRGSHYERMIHFLDEIEFEIMARKGCYL